MPSQSCFPTLLHDGQGTTTTGDTHITALYASCVRSLLAVLMLVISSASLEGVQADTSEDELSTSFDVILMGDRQTESISETFQDIIGARTTESSVEAVTGESLGMAGHLAFYMEGLSPWQEVLSTQSDYLLSNRRRLKSLNTRHHQDLVHFLVRWQTYLRSQGACPATRCC